MSWTEAEEQILKENIHNGIVPLQKVLNKSYNVIYQRARYLKIENSINPWEDHEIAFLAKYKHRKAHEIGKILHRSVTDIKKALG